MKIYIINLDRSIDRLAQQQKQFAELGLSFERLPAVSVSEISEETYQYYSTKGQRLIKQSELACLFSHKKAWEQVILDNQPCVILEDDAILVKDFAEILNEIENTDLNTDFINLEVHIKPKIVSKNPIQQFKNYQLFELFLDKSGTGGYIIYPTGAKKLLEYFNIKTELADTFIYQCPTLNKAQIEPAVLLQSDRCEQYGVPFNDYPLQSMIGVIKNTVSTQLTTQQKIQLKWNRIIGQIGLGFLTIKALMRGVKRPIIVDSRRFMEPK